MKMPRLTLIGAMVIGILCLCVSPSLFAQDKPQEFRIGYQKIPNAELVAKHLGWYEKELGVPVKWVFISSGVKAHKGLSDGTLDAALLGSSPSAAAVAKGIPVQIIFIHDLIGDNEALIVKPNSGVENVEDLKGKTVAAPYGSTTHYHLMVSLMLHRVNPEDLKIVFLEPEEMAEAWVKGDIDAAFVWVPTLARLQAAGGRIILTSRTLVRRGFPTGDLCVIRTGFGKQYPDFVVQYLKIVDKAVQFCRQHPSRAADAIAAELGITKEEAAEQMNGLILLSAKEQNEGKYFGGTYWNFGLYTVLKETADFLKEAGVVKELPPRDAFLDGVNAAFLVRALEE
jgi:taurine transport system substrate-binding protein